MRLIISLVLLLISISPAALAQDKALYVFTKIGFVGDQAEIDTLRAEPLTGDLMRQLEADPIGLYAEYDPDTGDLTGFSPGQVDTLTLDPATSAVLDGETRVGDLIAATPTTITIHLTELGDVIPLDLEIVLERAAPDDPRILTAIAAIERFEAERVADRSRALEQLAAPSQPGRRIGLLETELAVAAPFSFTYAERIALQNNIVRHDFAHASDGIGDTFLVFEVPSDAVAADVFRFFLQDHRWDMRVEEDERRLGRDPFGSALLLARARVGEQELVTFAKSDSETAVLAWYGVFKTLSFADDVDAPTVGEMLADPALFASLGGTVDLAEGVTASCQQELARLTDVQVLVKAAYALPDTLFSDPSFPHVRCSIPLGQSSFPVSTSLRPGFAIDQIPMPDGTVVVYQNENAVVFAADASSTALKAFRILDVDGVPAVLEASPWSVQTTLQFLQMTGGLDLSALTFPPGWRRHLGAFRSLTEHQEAPGYFAFSRPEDAFIEGLINQDGEILVDAIYDEIDPFPGGFIVKEVDGPEGAVTPNGDVLLPTEYENIVPQEHGLLLLYRTDGKQQIFDAARAAHIGAVYDRVEIPKDDDVIIVKEGDLHRFLNRDMTPAFDGAFKSVRRIAKGRFIVTQGDKDGLIDGTGATLIPVEQSRVWPHGAHRLLFVRDENQSAYFDYDGQRITPEELKVHYAPSKPNGHITVSDARGRFGAVDKTGRIIIEPSYAQLHQFREGFIPASKLIPGTSTPKFGLIDEEEAEVLPFEFDNLHLVHNGRLWARKDGLWGLIGIDGSQFVEFVYSALSRAQDRRRHDSGEDTSLMIAKKDDRFGVVDHSTGDVILPFEFTDAKPQELRLFKDGEWLVYPRDFKPD